MKSNTPRSRLKQPNTPLVSVIVPTKNSSEFLEACMRSVRAQTYHNIELVVVDNHSTDATCEIAKKYAGAVYTKGPERSAQRNYGVQHSKGVAVVIIDSDMELAPDVVESCVRALDDATVVGVIIPEESFGKGFWAQCKRLERSFYVGIDWIEAARCFRRSTYLAVGGYDTSLVSGEDWDLSQRVGQHGRLARAQAYIRHNEGRLTLRKTLHKKYYYSRMFHAYTTKRHTQTKQQTNLCARYWLFFSHPRCLFKNPVVGCGMLYMKTAEFVTGGFGMLQAAIVRRRKEPWF